MAREKLAFDIVAVTGSSEPGSGLHVQRTIKGPESQRYLNGYIEAVQTAIAGRQSHILQFTNPREGNCLSYSCNHPELWDYHRLGRSLADDYRTEMSMQNMWSVVVTAQIVRHTKQGQELIVDYTHPLNPETKAAALIRQIKQYDGLISQAAQSGKKLLQREIAELYRVLVRIAATNEEARIASLATQDAALVAHTRSWRRELNALNAKYAKLPIPS